MKAAPQLSRCLVLLVCAVLLAACVTTEGPGTYRRDRDSWEDGEAKPFAATLALCGGAAALVGITGLTVLSIARYRRRRKASQDEFGEQNL